MAGRLPWVGALVSGGMVLGELRDGDMAGALRESGTAFGAAAGGMIGAAVGSVVPVLGTTLGGLIGAVLGGAAGGSLLDAAAGLFGGDREFSPAEQRRRDRRRRGAEQRRERLTTADADPPDTGSPGPRLSRLERRRRRRPPAPAGSLRTAESREVALPEKRESRYERLRARPAAPPVVDRRDQRTNISITVPPGGENAQETAERIADVVRRELKRRDQEREDDLNSVVADRPRMVFRY